MKSLIIIIILLSLTIPAFAQFGNETITITTYYPSPYGVYRNLEMYPSDEPTVGVKPGVMYFNKYNSTLLIYINSTAKWQPVGAGSGQMKVYKNDGTLLGTYGSGDNVSPCGGWWIVNTGGGITKIGPENCAEIACALYYLHPNCSGSMGWMQGRGVFLNGTSTQGVPFSPESFESSCTDGERVCIPSGASYGYSSYRLPGGPCINDQNPYYPLPYGTPGMMGGCGQTGENVCGGAPSNCIIK